ncbi:chromosome segregation protein SMC [bacterium]|nr:chromosome segregation protein SMC [bacterium]
MILSKVSIHGFKSFAKKEELKFDGGLTVIVGPNGCGKTNVVDAIRWGLGEQRPSVLRADRMDSLIFGGAQSAKPLGMAEVSLIFDNSRHILPIDYNEVAVTRRLYRSGESDYLLNKNIVRLKDIQDLLMDTGIGADAYSVIELKMVEDILSEKAEDRRKLIEEAAGVTKYKYRLKAALRKLDATQTDLLRVNDIIQEVDRTVRSLKRQVSKAQRYQEVQEELKDLELNRGSYLYDHLQSEIEPLRKDLSALVNQKEGRTTEISKDETELESYRLQVTEKEKALIEVQEALSEIVERIHRREGDIRVGRERTASLEDRIQRYVQEIETLNKRLDEQKTHLEIATRDREALQVKITSTGRIFTNKKKELEVFQQGLNLKRLELNQHKKRIINCLEETNQLSSDETQLRAQNDGNRGRLERLDEEDKNYHETINRVQVSLKAIEADCQKKRKKQQQVKANRNRIQSEIDLVRKAIESRKEQFFRDQGELDSLQSRLGFLQNLIESREGMASGSRELIKMKAKGLVGVLADLVDVASEYRQAVETGLGEAAGYLVFDKTDTAVDALEYLRHHDAGKATMVSMDLLQSGKHSLRQPKIPADSDVIGWTNDLITCDARYRPLMDYLVGDLLLVKNIKAARRLVPVFKDHFIRLVTMDGELMTTWGYIKTRESSRQDTGMVGRKRRAEELTGQIDHIRKRIHQSEKELKKENARLESMQLELQKVNTALSDVESELIRTEKDRDKLQFETEQSESGLLRNSDERANLLKAIETGKAGLDNIRPQMEALLEEREKLEQKANHVQAEVDRLEKEEEALEEDVHRHNLAVVRLNGEAKNLDYDIDRSNKLIEEIQSTISQRSREIEEAKESIVRLKEETEQYEKRLLEEFSERDEKEGLRQNRESDYQKLRDELTEKEKEIRQVRRDRDEVSEKIHHLEMQINDLTHRAQSLKDSIRERYHVNIETRTTETDLDVNETGKQIDILKQKLDNMGPVNLLALEEYDQEKKRLDFLMQQRDDLLSAEQTLNETILRINETARTRFNDVYQKVRTNFQEIFKRFFRGGDADLLLPEREDPLEARIEIKARPAGKQLRDIDLLSGGEKALTAISLLFALYLVKPSPVCVLDEIDAPLDDANVRRFTRVLEEFAQKTQFIIVTHNKMTMRCASSLYGVTMQEQGVSKIVSVKFADVDNDTGQIRAQAAG